LIKAPPEIAVLGFRKSAYFAREMSEISKEEGYTQWAGMGCEIFEHAL
jgi:hypothetical protein